MHSKLPLFLALFVMSLIALNGPTSVDADFWDGVPVVSQVKSVVQLIAGDPEAATNTQMNYLNQAPFVPEITNCVNHCGMSTLY